MGAKFIVAAGMLVMAGLAGGCMGSSSSGPGPPPEGISEERLAAEERWIDEDGLLRVRSPWLVSEAQATRFRDIERAKGDPDKDYSLYNTTTDSRVKEEGVFFYREFIREKDLKMLGLHENLLGRPGPPLAGKADNNVLHWLDAEYIEAAPIQFDYRARLFPSASVSGAGKMGYLRQDATARVESAEAWIVAGPDVRYRRLDFFRRPTLPDTGERFPAQLSNFQAGMTFPWVLPPGIWNVTFGSASDRLFDSGDEVTADITWAIGSPLGGTDGVIFYVNWQNNRDWANRRPIPGAAYRYKQGNWFTLVAGFPDSAASWRPNEKFELSGSYSFPRTVSAEVAYRPCQAVRIYGGFDWSSQRYFRHGRSVERDRLWHVAKELSVGVRWDIDEHLFVDFSGGYAFDRFWFEGETYNDRDFNRIDVEDGPYLGFKLGLRF